MHDYSGHPYDAEVYWERKRNPYEGVSIQTPTREEMEWIFGEGDEDETWGD